MTLQEFIDRDDKQRGSGFFKKNIKKMKAAISMMENVHGSEHKENMDMADRCFYVILGYLSAVNVYGALSDDDYMSLLDDLSGLF